MRNLPCGVGIVSSAFLAFGRTCATRLSVDFIDDIVPDVISPNRSSLAWNDESLKELQDFLEEIIRYIQSEWRRLEKKARKGNIQEKFQVDTDEWRKSNQGNATITENIDKLLPLIDDPEQVPSGEMMKMFEIVHNLVPNHADFVLWSRLHPKITSNDYIRDNFFKGEYLIAAREAAQIYNEEVQRVSGRTEDGYALMEIVFGKENGKLIALTSKANENEENLETGQKHLSQGIMTGFKNPAVSHTSVTVGRSSGMFTDRNCLDIMSTISYLFDRLERRVSPPL